MSWEGPEITSHMVAAWEAGERDATALAVGALRAVYPTDGDGQALRWPTATADCAEKKVLESRVILRAQRLVAEGFDVEAEALWYAEGGY